jgi:hypothetical protein
MKIRIVMTFILLCYLSKNNAYSSDEGSTHFKIKCELNPESQHIYVNANLRLNPDEPLPDTLNFSLHKQFTILKITGNGIQDFVFDIDASPVSVFMRDARPLKITLNKYVDRNKPLDIVFEYEGTITEWSENCANVVTRDWVELGMYLPWFPSGFICGYFTYEIEARCDPAYQLRSYGSYSEANGIWHFKRAIPDFDINLVASKNLKTMERESGGYRIFFHYESLLAKTADGLSNDLANILEYYATWFGGKKGENFTVIQSAREKGGDYSRKGFIVATQMTDEKYINHYEKIIRNLGHESAHFWWNMAPAYSWEDWLNESFAEYSILLVIRKMFGDEAYNKWIADKSAVIENIPPIWGFNRNNIQASQGPDIIQSNLYNKGPVLLHQLSNRIGERAFILLCNEMVSTSVSSTDSFLILLEKNHGSKTRNWFEDLLKSY